MLSVSLSLSLSLTHSLMMFLRTFSTFCTRQKKQIRSKLCDAYLLDVHSPASTKKVRMRFIFSLCVCVVGLSPRHCTAVLTHYTSNSGYSNSGAYHNHHRRQLYWVNRFVFFIFFFRSIGKDLLH